MNKDLLTHAQVAIKKCVEERQKNEVFLDCWSEYGESYWH